MSIISKLLPSGIVDRYRAIREKKRMHAKRVAFYESFLSKGDLVFDIGANVGVTVGVGVLLGVGVKIIVGVMDIVGVCVGVIQNCGWLSGESWD